MKYVKVKNRTKRGYSVCKMGGVLDLSFPNYEARTGRVIQNGDISPALRCSNVLCRIEENENSKRDCSSWADDS